MGFFTKANNMSKTIFLSGLPRSLTTLMANTLAQNPIIKGGETSPLLEYLYAARGNFSNTPEVKSALSEEQMKDSFKHFCKGGVDAYSEYMAGKDGIYLDKSRGWIHYAPFLWDFMPNAKIIVCVRDIRSIISSLEKKWRENPLVLDGRDNPAQQNFITVDSRVNAFLNDPPLGIALKRLYNAHQTGVLGNKNILVVRAEDFAKNPKDVMQKVYKFIGEEYFDADYDNIVQKTIENDRISDFGIYGDHKIKSSIKPLVSDFKDVLTPSVASNVKANFQWFYETFNYF